MNMICIIKSNSKNNIIYGPITNNLMTMTPYQEYKSLL